MKTRNKKAPHYATQYGATTRSEFTGVMTRRPQAVAISRSFVPAWAIGGAMLLSSAMAHGTVIGVGDIHELPFTPLDNAPVHMAGGTLVAHMDAALSPLQKLVFEENTGSVVTVNQFSTLTIGGGVDLRGIAHFGEIGSLGVIQLTDGGPITVGAEGGFTVMGGTLRNAAGSDALSGLTRQVASTYVHQGGTLDFQGGTAHIKNLQGNGTVNAGFGSPEALVVEQGNFSGAILGGAKFKKVSSGTFEYHHDQGLSGVIEVAQGTLLAGGTGSYGTAGKSILNNGSLVFKWFAGGVSGDISGSGNVDATVNSLVALTGTNTYSGTTKIDHTSQIILADAGAPTDSSSTLGTGAVLNLSLIHI